MGIKHQINPFLLGERIPPAPGDETWQPKNVREWVHALPAANAGATARLLYQKLERLNLVEIPAADRMRILDHLFKPVQMVLRLLVNRYARGPIPMHQRTQQFVDLELELLAHIVVSYKIILQQIRENSLVSKLMHKQARATAMHRMMYFVGLMLLNNYRLYQPCAKGLWKELHRIYRYAERCRVQHRQVATEEPGHSKSSSIADVYKHLLLLSLAGPHRLLQGEVDKVNEVLSRLAPSAELQQYKPDKAYQGCFLTDRAVDQPPTYLARGANGQTRGWVLDTRPMAEALDQLLQQAMLEASQIGVTRPKDGSAALSVSLIRRLMLAWGVEAERRTDRVAASGKAHISCGLDAIHSLLGGVSLTQDEDFFPTVEDLPWLNSSAGDVVESIALEDDGARASWRIDSTTLEEVDTEPCDICNKSEMGYQLRWIGNSDVNLRVGELIGITEHIEMPTPDSWRVGVIRWMRAISQNEVECGIQLMDRQVRPISLRRIRKGRSRVERWNGLLMNPESSDVTLITPSFYASEEDLITLMLKEGDVPIVLEQAMEITGSFAQFMFSQREDHQVDAPPEIPQTVGHSDIENKFKDYENVWRNL